MVPTERARAARAQFGKAFRSLGWLLPYGWQQLTWRSPPAGTVHLLIALADHFEPEITTEAPRVFASVRERERRVGDWCRQYPTMADPWRDADGRPFRHTYFCPAEHYDKNLIDRLAQHCRAGWGEIEIHLHHGVEVPDTAEGTRRRLVEFRNALARHGCLSTLDGAGPPRYAFVHGNWALANSAGGRFCGVDSEMEILAETGCYADLTLPSAPDPAQIRKINALYECGLSLHRRAPHRRGSNLRRGRPPQRFPLMIQGPLALNFARRLRGWPIPGIENGELTARNAPTMQRLRLWRRLAIGVKGRPDWVFIKLHCHAMVPEDTRALLGEPMRRFLQELIEGQGSGDAYRVHFVTAREMVNIVLAACDGKDGDPGTYRDYRLRML